MKIAGAVIIAILAASAGFAFDKKTTEQRYTGKYLVVLREQLAVGICGDAPDVEFRPVLVVIDGDHVKFDKKTRALKFAGVMSDGTICHNWLPESLHHGEVLRVKSVVVQDDNFALTVETISPHSITRGQGENQHGSRETGVAEIHFQYPAKRDYDAAVANADKWVKPFDTLEAAEQFGKGLGNSASGAFVKEVKLGMTQAEVEAVMGLPISKADLGEKMLYKYKDMTVEFHGGKVTDVR